MPRIEAHWLLLSLLVSGACFAGSAAQATLDSMTTEKPGSPWHWVSESFGGGTALERQLLGKPGRTIADDRVKADVLKQIGTFEEKTGGAVSPGLLEVRQLPKEKGQYHEIWVVTRGNGKAVYTVALQPAAGGGVDFSVQGPWD